MIQLIEVIKVDNLSSRKTTRLNNANYYESGLFFLTICTKERQCILSSIVGTGVLDGPKIQLTKYGNIADKYIKQLNDFYPNISVESYVIMPNHIHILLHINGGQQTSIEDGSLNGPSGTPVPTIQNSTVSKFVSTFKRFCNKECAQNIWQYRSYDHIIRNKKDLDAHLKYIYENPINWIYDEFYPSE